MRSEERARQILACAKRVFAERGFHAANISHICEAAKIGRGTLYLYFRNKRSVLEAILRETLDRVRSLMERQSAETMGTSGTGSEMPPPTTVSRSVAIEVYTKQLRDLLRVVFDDQDTLRIVLREAVGLDVDVEALLRDIDATLIALVERDLVVGQRAGFIRECNAHAVATMIVGGVEKLALAALRSDAPVDLDLLAREAARLHAIGTISDNVKAT